VQASSWVSRRITWANSDIGAGALGQKDSGSEGECSVWRLEERKVVEEV